MKSEELYETLARDFEIDKFKDDWSFVELNEHINPTFSERYIGVMLDNTDEIRKVYTSVFPDKPVLDKIIGRSETDILFLSHHAMGYDPNIEGLPFYNIPISYLEQLNRRRISFYVLHIPLDRNGQYSTSVSLAQALQLPIQSEFCEYLGFNLGVVCDTTFQKLVDLVPHVEKGIGHEIRVRQYGDDIIEGGRVAVAAGGGCMDFVARELAALGINTYLTGCTRPIPTFEPNVEFHRIAQENGINVVGATHYSTEKYACMAMVEYFARQEIEAEFIAGAPCMEDL